MGNIYSKLKKNIFNKYLVIAVGINGERISQILIVLSFLLFILNKTLLNSIIHIYTFYSMLLIGTILMPFSFYIKNYYKCKYIIMDIKKQKVIESKSMTYFEFLSHMKFNYWRNLEDYETFDFSIYHKGDDYSKFTNNYEV